MTSKADQAAAERLLKAAVKRAVYEYHDIVLLDGENPRVPFARNRVTNMLRAAGESAELLLGEAS